LPGFTAKHHQRNKRSVADDQGQPLFDFLFVYIFFARCFCTGLFPCYPLTGKTECWALFRAILAFKMFIQEIILQWSFRDDSIPLGGDPFDCRMEVLGGNFPPGVYFLLEKFYITGLTAISNRKPGTVKKNQPHA
jgi:hypothetical protein